MASGLEKFCCFMLGRKTDEEKISIIQQNRNKYRKEAMEEYKSKTLDGWLDERAKMDLNPNDNIAKYKADLKRWFKRTAEAFNFVVPYKWLHNTYTSKPAELWREKFGIKDKDFPLIYYIKDSEQMLNDIGYERYVDYNFRNTDCYEENPLGHWLVRYPRPWKYKKHRVTITHEYKETSKKKRPRRKKRNG